MEQAVLDLKYWGNSLGLRLPASIAREAHLQADQKVRIVVDHGRVIITPILQPELTLVQRLAKFDPKQHGGEVMSDDLRGAERW
jgi:antitoxin MazE